MIHDHIDRLTLSLYVSGYRDMPAETVARIRDAIENCERCSELFDSIVAERSEQGIDSFAQAKLERTAVTRKSRKSRGTALIGPDDSSMMVPRSRGAMTSHISLLAKLREKQDADALEEFHLRYSDLIISFARRRGLQIADCEEILQNVLLALTVSLPGMIYDPFKGTFGAYLKTVTVRAVARFCSENHKPAPLEGAEVAGGTALLDTNCEAAWEAEWRQHHLKRAMRVIEAEFSKRDLAAFDAYAIQGEEVDQVAATLGMSAGQIYHAKSRIVKRLREVVQRQVDEEG